MKPAANPSPDDTPGIHFLPRWVTASRSETPDTVAFSSGAALAMLAGVLGDPGDTLPVALLRDRMALEAAVACLKLEGRDENTSAIRDAVCLARAGEALGPAGDMFVAWRRLARINLNNAGWRDRLMKLLPDQVAETMQDSKPQVGSPVAQAAQMLADALEQFPRQEAAALMLADVTLAGAIGRERVLPWRCHVNHRVTSLWAPTPEIMQRSSLAATVLSRRRGLGGVFGGRPDGVGR